LLPKVSVLMQLVNGVKRLQARTEADLLGGSTVVAYIPTRQTGNNGKITGHALIACVFVTPYHHTGAYRVTPCCGRCPYLPLATAYSAARATLLRKGIVICGYADIPAWKRRLLSSTSITTDITLSE